jgi:hypothetical protein
MAAGNTYTAIATQTLGSAATSVTFSSIPSTYTDLILICSMIATATLDSRVTFNSDSGTNYSATRLMGDGTSATSNRSSNRAWIDLNYVGGVGTTAPTTSILQMNNYSNATTYKTTLLRANELSGTYQGTEAAVGLWRNTAAITRLDIVASASTFATGSTFSLYGIAAA